MAIVPSTYRFIKENNGNVLVTSYNWITIVDVFSFNPSKDLRKSENYPDQVIIPIHSAGGHVDNRFLSIPFDKIDLANSTPPTTNPISANDAISKLQEGFFFEPVSGGGGGGNVNYDGDQFPDPPDVTITTAVKLNLNGTEVWIPTIPDPTI